MGSVSKDHKPALDRRGITGMLAGGSSKHAPTDCILVKYQPGQKLQLYHEAGYVVPECVVAQDGRLLSEGRALETSFGTACLAIERDITRP